MADALASPLRGQPAESTRPPRLPVARALAFASLGIPAGIVALMMNTYMPRFYAAHEGLALSSVASIFLIVRLLDIPFDPFVGLVIDQTRTRFGRYKFWLLAGIPLVMGACWGLFMPPGGAGVGYLTFWLVAYNAGQSIVILSYTSWTSSLAPHYADRSRLFGLCMGISTLGSICVLLLPLFTHGRITAGANSSMETIGWICILLLPVSALLLTVFVPDRPATTQTVRPGMGLKAVASVIRRPTVIRLIIGDFCLFLALSLTAPIQIFFLNDVKGLSLSEISVMMIFLVGSGAFGFPAWGWMAARVGKHMAIQIACLAYVICHLTLVFLPPLAPGHALQQMIPIAMALFAIGFCGSAFGTSIRAMIGDVADELLLETGVNRTGLLYSMVSTTTKVGGALGVITFPLLVLFGYSASEKVINTPHAIFGLTLIYGACPIIFLIIGGITFRGYSLDAQRHAEIRRALEAPALRTPAG